MAFRGGYGGYGGGFPEYVSAAQRKLNALKEVQRLEKSGRKITPVTIAGRVIARTFWGRSWCENLEAYSDIANRLPRGRTYVRNGSVLDLQIAAGKISALVSGSSLYKVELRIKPLDAKKWQSIVAECSGGIDSLIELLRGEFSQGVMQVITRKGTGLFPTPAEMDLSCSCPDGARMCKHVAATLYGVGSRLDSSPDLLFVLRGVDQTELIRGAAAGGAGIKRPADGAKVLAGTDLSSIFGIEIETGDLPPASVPRGGAAKKNAAAKKNPLAEKPIANKPSSRGKKKST